MPPNYERAYDVNRGRGGNLFRWRAWELLSSSARSACQGESRLAGLARSCSIPSLGLPSIPIPSILSRFSPFLPGSLVVNLCLLRALRFNSIPIAFRLCRVVIHGNHAPKINLCFLRSLCGLLFTRSGWALAPTARASGDDPHFAGIVPQPGPCARAPRSAGHHEPFSPGKPRKRRKWSRARSQPGQKNVLPRRQFCCIRFPNH